MDKTKFLDGRVIVKTGDITKESVDSVVNAANLTLLGGGGVTARYTMPAGPRSSRNAARYVERNFLKGFRPARL